MKANFFIFYATLSAVCVFGCCNDSSSHSLNTDQQTAVAKTQQTKPAGNRPPSTGYNPTKNKKSNGQPQHISKKEVKKTVLHRESPEERLARLRAELHSQDPEKCKRAIDLLLSSKPKPISAVPDLRQLLMRNLHDSDGKVLPDGGTKGIDDKGRKDIEVYYISHRVVLWTDLMRKLASCDPFWHVREKAAVALGMLGPAAESAIPDLLIAARSPFIPVRNSALWAIGQISSRAQLEPFYTALANDNPEMRAGAASALAIIPGAARDSVNELSRAVNDEDPMVRQLALRTLMKAGLTDKEKASLLRKGLKDSNLTVRLTSVVLLREVESAGAECSQELHGALGDEDSSVRRETIVSIVKMRLKCVSELREVLTDVDVSVRQEAIRALVKISPDDAAATPELRKALSDSDKNIRKTAAKAWVELGTRSVVALPELRQALLDTNHSVFQNAAIAVSATGPKGKEAIPELIQILNDPKRNYNRRLEGLYEAARVLGSFGTDSLTEVQKVLTGTDHNGRYLAAITLSYMGPPAAPAVPELIAILTNRARGPDERRAAAEALASIGAPQASRAIPELCKALYVDYWKPVGNVQRSGGWERYYPGYTFFAERVQAAQSLGQFGPAATEAAEDLRTVLQGQNKHVRIAAAEALGKLGSTDEATITALREAVKDSDEEVVCMSLSALYTLLGEKFMDELQVHLHHKSGIVRNKVVEILCDFQSKNSQILPVMTEMAKTKSTPSYRKVIRTLLVHGPKGREELRQIVNSKEEISNLWFIRTIANLAKTDKEAFMELQHYMKCGSVKVKALSIEELGKIGPSAKSAIPGLLEASKSESTYVRSQAMIALGKVGSAAPAEVLPTLCKGLNDSEWSVRRNAATALGFMGSAAMDAVEQLKEAAERNEGIRGYVLQALEKIDPESDKSN